MGDFVGISAGLRDDDSSDGGLLGSPVGAGVGSRKADAGDGALLGSPIGFWVGSLVDVLAVGRLLGFTVGFGVGGFVKRWHEKSASTKIASTRPAARMHLAMFASIPPFCNGQLP